MRRKRPRRRPPSSGPLTVAVACNLKDGLDSLRHRPEDMDRYAEWDTEETVTAIEGALADDHRVVRLVANDLPQAFEALRDIRPDIVFNIVEGLGGVNRESYFPSMCEMLDIPYTGSDPLTLSLCLDKARAKQVLSSQRIPTAGFTVVSGEADLVRLATLRAPLIVKPLHEGSSKGITNDCLVRESNDAPARVMALIARYGQPALVEEFLPGREFTVALLGNGSDVQVLPPVEILFDGLPREANPIYSFEAKWVWDTPDNPMEVFRCPADVDGDLLKRIESAARSAFLGLSCKDWCRIDVRLDAAGTPHVIELNPLPGILPRPEENSCFPKAARAAGLSYKELIGRVLSIACHRYGLS